MTEREFLDREERAAREQLERSLQHLRVDAASALRLAEIEDLVRRHPYALLGAGAAAGFAGGTLVGWSGVAALIAGLGGTLRRSVPRSLRTALIGVLTGSGVAVAKDASTEADDV